MRRTFTALTIVASAIVAGMLTQELWKFIKYDMGLLKMHRIRKQTERELKQARASSRSIEQFVTGPPSTYRHNFGNMTEDTT